MFKNKVNFKLLNLLILFVIIYIGLNTMDYWWEFISKVFSVLLPFIIAFAIAYALYPIVRKLENKGVRKSLAISIVVVLILGVVALMFSITLPLLYEQLISLSKLASNVIGDISKKFDWNLGSFESTINGALNNVIQNLGTYVSNGTFDLINKSISFVTKSIIVLIASIYFLSYMEKIRNRSKVFLKNYNKKAFNYVKVVDDQLENYLEGLVIFMGIQLVEYSFLFWVVGHPNWLLLGILACLTTVIPYFGGIITNIIAVLLSSVVSIKLFIATMIICLVFPNIDGYIISPKVYGKTNNVNPLGTIFAVFAGGSLFGFIGIVISLPLYIIIAATYKFFKKDIYGKLDELI